MSIPAHAVMSGLIASYISPNPYFIGVSVVLGIYADLARFIHGGGVRDGHHNWETYEEWHRLDIVGLCIPFHNLHTLIDYFLHKREGGWNLWGYTTEIIFWLIIGKVYIYERVWILLDTI